MKQLEQKLDSREVAEMVGKEHHKLLRDIRSYIEQLGESKIGYTDFFQESTYRTTQNKEMPCYFITKKGCEFIAHKLTGIKGTEFTAKYINRFHEMEDELLVDPRRLSVAEQIQILALGNGELVERIDNVEKELKDFKEDMPLLAVECEKITNAVKRKGVRCLGGKDSNAYHDNSLRNKVYRDIHTEVRRQFGVETYKALKRNQCEMAVQIIEGYKLPFALEEAVQDCNAQLFLK
ncbi:MAG: ORF6C domain-containing protein [Clostridiales bacterium]|nr:ORF6C domain-containing protein [Clostridiales bacterium]